LEQRRQQGRRADTDGNAGRGQARRLAEHHAQHRARFGAQGEPHPQFPRALADHQGHHPVHAHGGQDEGERAEGRDQPQDETSRRHRLGAHVEHRLHVEEREPTVEVAQAGPHRLGHGGGRAAGAQHEERRDRRALAMGDVQLGRRCLVERRVAHAADHADDGHPRVARRIRPRANPTAHRVFAREEPRGHLLVDDRHRRRLRTVAAGERASARDRDLHGAEEVVDGAAELHLGQLGVRPRPALDVDRRRDGRAAERQARRPARGDDAGHRPQPLEQLVVVGEPGVGRRQAGRERHLHGQQAGGREPRIDGEQAREAAQEQCGAGAQQHRQRHLADDEAAAQPPRRG